MGKKNRKLEYSKIIKNKKLPILTLDVRWHELFPENEKPEEIRGLEQRVNNLLKKQGKLINEIKDMKKLKNSLIKDIMVNMDIGTDLIGKAKEKKLGKNKQYINEINEKIHTSMDELSEIPYQIKEVNEELMVESMNICYNQIENNKEEIKKIADWIAGIRDELKNKIMMKQDMESKNSLFYTYMHDLLGAELIDGFDKENNKKSSE